MDFVIALLTICFGLAGLFYGLFFFYTLLPLFYGFIGFLIGVNIGIKFDNGNSGIIALIAGIALAVILAIFAVSLDKLAKSLIGAILGAGIGGIITLTIKVESIIAILIVLGCAVILGLAMLALYDPIIIIATAIAGAGNLLGGLSTLLKDLNLINLRDVFNGGPGGVVSILIWLALIVFGIIFQFTNRSQLKRQKKAITG